MGQTETNSGNTEGVKASTMQAAIMAFGVITLPMLVVTFVMGYGAHYGWYSDVATHVRVGLITVILTILTHTTTMFYFMGTGSAMKSEVRERNLDPDFLVRARAFKGVFFYMLFFGILLVMGAGMLGGGAHADLLRPNPSGERSILSHIHEWMAVTALTVNLVALVMTPVYIARNNRLMDDVGDTRPESEQIAE